MNNRLILTTSFGLLLAAGCDQTQQVEKPTLHEVMAGTIDPVADVIWEVASKSYGMDGNAHAGLLTDKDWLEIQQAGRKLHDGAMVISNNPDIRVVKPGTKILDEGVVAEAVTAAQVEAYVDRDRPALAKHAQELSQIALAIEAAARSRDASTTVRLSEELDYVCEACHQRFWYPDQKLPPAAR